MSHAIISYDFCCTCSNLIYNLYIYLQTILIDLIDITTMIKINMA